MNREELLAMPINELSEDDFMEAYGRLVHYTIWKSFRGSLTAIYKNTGMDREDLVQIGSIGLTKARGRFDVTRELKFSTYCVPLIWGEIQRAMRESYKVRLSRGLLDIRHKAMSMKLLDESPEAVAEILELPLAAVKEALHYIPGCASLNKPLEGTNLELGDIIMDDDSNKRYLEVENNNILGEFLSTLDEREKGIWDLHSAGLKQSQIASELSITQAHVSRLLAKITKQATEYGKQQGLHRHG